MKQKENYALILSAMVLSACGGGGGGVGGSPSLVKTAPTTGVATTTAAPADATITTGAPAPMNGTATTATVPAPITGNATPLGAATSITGTITPPATPASGAILANADVLIPANSTGTWSSIVQGADYTFDLAAAQTTAPVLKIVSANIQPINTQTASTSISTGAATGDPSLGQPLTITNTLAGTSYTESLNTGGTLSQYTVSPGLSGFAISSNNGTVYTMAEYVLPFSPTLSSAGYTYQTPGAWVSNDSTTGIIRQYFFSTGAPTTTPLPVSGTASYTGHVIGAYVNASTRDPAGISATLNASADFAALNVSFSTTGTTVFSSNALPGTLPAATPELDMSGILNYVSGSNTFTGPVTTVNGMTGNATGRFYGPGITVATPLSIAGTPPEIGGTFAVMGTGIGTMQGAFGGTTIPWATITRITGTVTPPAAPAAPGPVLSAVAVAPSTILLPNVASPTYPAIAQAMNYSFDPAAPQSMKASMLSFSPVDPTVSVRPELSVTGTPNAPTLAPPSAISIFTAPGIGLATNSGATMTNSTVAGLSAVTFSVAVPGGIGSLAIGYALPYSSMANPTGYIYQTFGAWLSNSSANNFWEGWFSTGVPTAPATLPVTGKASYTGQAAGTYVDAATRDVADTEAKMNATADFAAFSVAFATTGTTSLLRAAPVGTIPASNPGLDMSGTLSYVAGNNTFTGAVTTANGMSGNATGRFYGPANSSAGIPPEIGGTFAVAGIGVGAMEGAFAGTSTTGPATPAPTSISGTVAPLAAVPSITVFGGTNMRTPPNSVENLNAVVQSMDYTFDPAASAAPSPTLKAVNVNIMPANIGSGGSNYFYITTGAGYPTDPTLGQTTMIMNSIGGNAYQFYPANPVVSQITDIAGLPTVTFTNSAAATKSEYVLPYSVTLNPSGYSYQTFGSWQSRNGGTGVFSENYFSAGVITFPGTLPIAGTATYTGRATGSFVDAATRDPASIAATMNATANFANLNISFATTGTTTLSANAAAGTLPTASPGLNMSGTLNFAAGGNTFTGAVTTANGMSGNATGRFYGPSFAAATLTKVAGAPPEIGGTFAVTGATGAMQGAFGGK